MKEKSPRKNVGVQKDHPAYDEVAYRSSFESKLGDFFNLEGKASIMHAFDEACKCHPLTQKRDEGIPYRDHVVESALTLVEFGIRNPDDIVIMLLHDGIEESGYIVSRDLPFERRIKEAKAWLAKEFNQEVANGVAGLTKPTSKDVNPPTKVRARKSK